MISIQLTLRDRNALRQWNLDEWSSLVVLSALSAQPETLGEVAAAVQRYQPERQLTETGRTVAELDQACSEAGLWCLVDLVGRTVVASPEFELPEPRSAYEPSEGEQIEGFPIVWLDTPDDWVFSEAGPDWRSVVDARAEAAAGRQPLDARSVLFGQPLLEFLAAGLLASTGDAAVMTEEDRFRRTQAIHSQWLMTAREDLGGQTPRQRLLAERKQIDIDLQHRAKQWSMQQSAPPPLPPDAHTCRFGGFGTTQVVLNFDMIRALMEKGWKLVRREPAMAAAVLVERLADHRDRWLASPVYDEPGDSTRGELIELEQRRMPATSVNSPYDCDCPICQAEAAGKFGPSFMWFDGHHLEMEDEFAFSLIESLDEWQVEQQSFGTLDEETDLDDESDLEEEDEEDRVTAEGADGDPSVWQHSYVNWDMALGSGTTPDLAKTAIAYPLAELVTDLKQQPDGRTHLEALNATYAELREAQDATTAQSAAARFSDRLEEVARTYPTLVPKSADLQSRVDEVWRRPK